MQLNTPLPLAPQDRKPLNAYISLRDWHFKAMIQDRCIEISSRYITWEKDEEGHSDPVKAIIYGLSRVYTNNNQQVTCNYFIHYQGRVYQAYYRTCHIAIADSTEGIRVGAIPGQVVGRATKGK